ncbi:MAG TPA: restriction endonuclease subunit S [Flavobacteriales bacterium]|nr:restriction endonuclease subunit S [Flavobacteriales bacterium]HMR28854.1 restriction endonuclease subunit S [Flavobacteriales bacterium]
MSALPPYPAYKPTAIPWLQQVPEHWEFLPFSAIARIKSVTGQVQRQLLSVYLNRGVIPFTDVAEKRTNVTSEDLSRYQAVDPGDFVLNNQQAWRGSVGVSKHSGIVSPAYLVLTLSDRVNPDYANTLFRQQLMVDQYMVCSKGVGSIQRNLYWPSLRRVSVLLPPVEEQALIVRYLHALDAKVKRYIRAKRNLIARLQEQKQAIIQRAVTRGLDPNVKLKSSGVEWLGEVPEHWEVVRLRTAFLSVDSGVWGVDVEREDDEDNVYCMRAADFDMQTYSLNPAKRILRKVNVFDRKRKSLIKGDLLLEKSGGGDAVPVGRVVYADGALPMVFSNFLTRLRPDQRRFDAKYLLYLLNTLHGSRVILADIKQTTGLQNLDERAYLGRTILMPKLDEQRLIVAQLDRDFEKVNQAMTIVQRDIQLMQEYHTRLIADVVTGAVDLRAAAQALAEDQMIGRSDDQMTVEEIETELNEETE